jgi:hypothetical protein
MNLIIPKVFHNTSPLAHPENVSIVDANGPDCGNLGIRGVAGDMLF